MNCPKCNTETHIDSSGVVSCVSCGHRVEPYNNADLMKRDQEEYYSNGELRTPETEARHDINIDKIRRLSNDAGEKLQSVEDTLVERGNRYGEFRNHARLSQKLKTEFDEHVREYGQPDNFTDEISEAIDMIMHKLARIANGDPQYIDNYVDIAGYAQLVIDEMEK